MGTAAHKSIAAVAGASTTPSATIGAAVSGDVKVLVLFYRSNSSAVTISSAPAGYTQRQAPVYWADGVSYYTVYTKAVTATESSGSVSFTLSTSCSWALAAIVATGDYDAISAEADSRIGYGTTATAPSVTTSVANTILYNVLCAVDWRAFAPPGTVTEIADVQGADLQISIGAGYQAIAASGATGTRAWSFRDPDTPANTLAAVGRSVSLSVKDSNAGDTVLSGDSTFPSSAYLYATTSIVASPTSFTVAPGAASQLITLVDQNGLPVSGATWSSSATSVATVTTPSDSSGQVTVTFVGSGSATLTGSYDDGMSSPTLVTVPVTVTSTTSAPTITTTSLAVGTVGSAYSQTISTTGTEPVTLAVTSGTLPLGLTLSGKVISGTPAVASTYAFSLTPSGPGGTGAAVPLSISVVSVSVPPTITTTTLASGTIGSPYAQNLTATGTGSITWSITSGNLPDGLTLDSATGAISGTPTQAATYSFQVQANSGIGSPATATLSIIVYAGATAAPVPETSGTDSFSPTISEILEEAFERAGSEMRSGYEYRTARRSLNLLTIEWASRGINLWTVEQGSIALVAGTATYNLPVDTVDLIEHTIRQNPGNTSTQTDININRISVSTYATIPNKLAQGRPIQIYIDRQTGVNNPSGIVYPKVTVWPVPPDNSYTLVYWRLRRIQDAGTGVNIPDIPFRFLPCLVAGLAFYIALKIPEGQGRLGALQAEYERQWQLASEEDREKASVRFVPRNMR